MNKKPVSVFFLAIVCLAGIALVVAQPTVTITPWHPAEPNITYTEGAVRTFNVTINQPVNVSWVVNKTEVFDESGANFSEYTNESAVLGYWNVTVNDTTPPNVTNYAPTGTKVSIKTNITATFSEAMNPSTLNNATIIVCNGSGSSITGIITYDSETNTAIFDPVNKLEYNETYHVTITTGVQDLAGDNMSSNFNWNFTTRREILKNPFVISGYVTYANGTLILNPTVNITNLINTGENFMVKTIENSHYYRMVTDSTHLHAGNILRIHATDGTIFNDMVIHEITVADIKNGGFRQNISGMPDLVITKIIPGNVVNNTFNVSYTVKNIGSQNASASNTSIYIDDKLDRTVSTKALTPNEEETKVVGPFKCPRREIKICADSGNAVDELDETNNCSATRSKCPLPNLYHGNLGLLCEHDFCEYETDGTLKIYYAVRHSGPYSPACNATINITTFARNGSVIDFYTTKESVWPLSGTQSVCKHSGLYNYSCGHNITVEVCLDSDNEIPETDETDNCQNETFIAPCLPDLVIVPGSVSGTWINRTNRTFNITYTVKNVGNANANASTTRVANTGPYCDNHPSQGDKIFDHDVPALAPGESRTRTVGPFTRLCGNLLDIPGLGIVGRTGTKIKISADCNETVSEGNEDNNHAEFEFGVPYLYFDRDMAKWVDGKNKTFRIEYRILNWGSAPSNESTVYVYIDGNRSNVTDTVPPISTYESGGQWYYEDRWGIGPLQMPEDKEMVEYKLCIDWGDGIESCTGNHRFGGANCEAEDGTLFSFSGAWAPWGVQYSPVVITKSCTFTGDIYWPGGIHIGGNDIVIDGNGSGICGDRSGCKPRWDDPYYRNVRAGIYNNHLIMGNGYDGCDNVTIKNMEIRNFCNGITMVDADNNRIENCEVHDNGVENEYTYGITVLNSDHTAIDNCSVYNNKGISPTGGREVGGHGIDFHDDCNYCSVTNGSVSNNYLSGIYASASCKHLHIANNTIEGNGECGSSYFCTGINLHRGGGGSGVATNSTVKNNVILNNTGSGIYVSQSKTSIKDNVVKGSKNGDGVPGNGIFVDGGMLTFLYNNTFCDNEGADIANEGFATFGEDNTCDTADDYDDEGTRGCSFDCGAGNGVCVGDVTGTVFGCGDVVAESCTFTGSMSCPLSENGLIAGADNITIDGAHSHHILTGNFTGIGIFSNHSGVTIKNLQVEDFSTGIKIENTSANVIDNCGVRKNLRTGINVSADNCDVCNSMIYDNVGPGILTGGSNNVFENNTVAKNRNGTGTLPGYGIYFSVDAKGNNITANAVGDNDATDIYNANGENTGDNNTCDTTHRYQDVRMKEKKEEYGCTRAWTTPDLIISNKYENWVDEETATYNVTYTMENIGKNESREAGPSNTSLYICGAHAADDPVDSLKPGENHTSTFGYTPTIPEEMDTDRIKVCADGANEVEENNEANNFYYKDNGWYSIEELFKLKEFDKEANNCKDTDEKGRINEWSKSGGGADNIVPGVACVCDGECGNLGRNYYKCGDTVTEPCTFEPCAFKGEMSCDGDGLIIGAEGVVIDGDGYAIGGSGSGIGCGIYNPSYDRVKIQNLGITGFGDGIKISYKDGGPFVKYNTIENCDICGNGISTSLKHTHGINLHYVDHAHITNNEIHRNTGGDTGCEAGGNGIFMYQCRSNTIEKNDIHDNRKGGIFMKMKSKSNYIQYNKEPGIYRNGQGGIIIRCVTSDHNKILNNDVCENNGDGIFVGGCDNTIKDNTVENNEAGFEIEPRDVVGDGDGIDMGRSDGSKENKLNGNTVCGNKGTDIDMYGEDSKTTGDDNICDTVWHDETHYYNDKKAEQSGRTGCTYPCSGILKPDLTITDMFGWWDSEGDRTYKVTYTVKNIGTANASSSFTNLQITGEDRKVDSVLELAPNGGSHTHTFGPFTLPSSRTSDKITIFADVGIDGDGDVDESNEDNNEKVIWFPPVLDRIVVSPETAKLKVGETQKFTATAYDQNGDIMEGIAISWSSSDEMVGTVYPDESPTNESGKATTVFTADSVGGTTITAESGGIRGYATVEVGFEKSEEPEVPSWRSGGGGRPPAGEENVTGYEPGPGGGTGEFGAGIGGEQLPVNESGAVGGRETRKSGHPFGMGGEIIETVKVVAPVFLIIMVIMVIALFYSGYFGEKRAHRRNFRREK